MKKYTIALAGNPNSGKTTLFNALTKSNQKVGNFAGVTIERHSGIFSLQNAITCTLIDLPGTYSIYPKTEDEAITSTVLKNYQNEKIDLVMVVVDATNVYRNLLLFSQIYDLKIPIILVLNMIDEAKNKSININIEQLKQDLNIPIVAISARLQLEIDVLKNEIFNFFNHPQNDQVYHYNFYTPNKNFLENITKIPTKTQNEYLSILDYHFNNKTQISLQEQTFETISRYQKISTITQNCVSKPKAIHSKTQKIDAFLLHPLFGYLIMIFIFIGIFQALFTWSSYPMDMIDEGMQYISCFIKNNLGKSVFCDFITNGLIAGIAGIVIFIPQIVLLFFFITILEESGYMARVMFLLDNFMKKVGLNGKSFIPLFTGAACAIPAIMSTRNINNKKERIITIFITPFISCSARIPVYTIIIATVIPSSQYLFGVFNMQALVMVGLYVLGFAIAMATSFLLSKTIKTSEKSFFMLELPNYRLPQIGNIWHTIYEKVFLFITESGKIILIISLILWLLSNFSPASFHTSAHDKTKIENESQKLENSFAGILGKSIEPIFSPLGFDWRIDIAIITSFAAREVFVSTISTIYSIQNQEDTKLIKDTLITIKDSQGKPFFTLARGVSILIFYALALQCMSTIAVSKRETGSWKIPILQFCYSLFLAYSLSYVSYKLLFV